MKKNTKRMQPVFTIQCYEDRQTSVGKDGHASEHINGKSAPEKKETYKQPPPPPPMPMENVQEYTENNCLKSSHDTLDSNMISKIPNMRKVATLTRTPAPEYNNIVSGNKKTRNYDVENAEVDSLESYKLKNTTNVQPKPPNHYFIKAPNGTETMKKLARPVSVTIGQYVNHVGGRKEPSKLEFLNGNQKGGHQISDSEPISSRLQSELALTLSRSNLRKKTEALGDGGR